MTNQPTVPGFTPRDDEDLDPAPDGAPEGLTIQDTPVIDATQIDGAPDAADDVEPSTEQ